jgi:type IV pilus assembly protein PilO
MAALTQQRRRFTALLLGMGVICLVAALFLLAPITASSAQRYQELNEKQQLLRAREAENKPIQRLSELIEKAKSDYQRFSSDRLTAFPSTVYNNIYDLARKNNVSLGEMKYEAFDDPPEASGLKLLHVKARVSGGYPDLVKFINALERNKLFFVIRDLQLSDTRGQSGLQLQLSMDTYLRPRQPDEKPGVLPKSASDEEEDDSE